MIVLFLHTAFCECRVLLRREEKAGLGIDWRGSSEHCSELHLYSDFWLHLIALLEQTISSGVYISLLIVFHPDITI